MSDIFEKFNMNGQVALVTGAAGLLGRQFSRTLAQAGAAVVAADLNGAAVEQVADAISIMDASGDIEYVNQAFAALTGQQAPSEELRFSSADTLSGKFVELYFQVMLRVGR